MISAEHSRLFRLNERSKKVKSNVTIALLKRIFNWRWVSVLLLGISSNLLINIILDFKYQRSLVSFSLEEYFNAIIASIFLLEGTRWIIRILDNKLPWSVGVRRRLMTQLSLQLLFIIATLNALVISVTYFFYGGFYGFGDLMVINISVVSLVFLFTLIDTGIFFFSKWKTASNQKDTPRVEQKTIQLSVGKTQHLITAGDIRCAIGQSGLVVIVTKEGRRLPYSQSLDALMTKLDPQLFFRANRQTILTHGIVQSMKALEYGKIQVSLLPDNGHPSEVTISRTRAAEFRKWMSTQTV